MKKITFLSFGIFLLLLAATLPMVGQVTFMASADAKQIVEGNQVEVTFTLNNANGTEFKAPPFKNFEVVGGPSRAISSSNYNGQISRSIAYSYVLEPKKNGKLTIAPATVKVDGKIMKTKSLNIDVVKSGAASKSPPVEEQVFIKAEIDTNLVYVGQQLVINYKLYTTVNIDNYDITFEPEYQGFFSRDIHRYDSRQIREVVDGVQYTTKVLKRIALFPQQSGLQTLEPLNIRLGVIVGQSRSRSLFYRNKIRQINVKTNAIDVDVRALPEPIPPSFSGAVGKYSMTSFVDKTNLSTDDIISVQLVILGNGDVKRLQPPPIAFPASFETYDPKVIDEVSQESGGILKGKKQIEYLALPQEAGQYQIKPSFTYFDTESAEFVTLTPNLFNFNIRQGKNTPKKNSTTFTKIENQDIRYIKTATTFNTKSNLFAKSGLFYGLLFLPFLVLGGALIYKQILANKGNIDLTLLKSKKAEKVAIKRLATAQKFLKQNKSRSFYDEVSRAMLGYVCDKLSIPLSELTKDNVQQKLHSLNVKTENITDFMSILKITEMALFAGMDNSTAMQDTYQKSVNVISEIETELNG